MPRLKLKSGISAAALGACLSLLLAAPALGATRHAEPEGDGDPATCLVTDPCDIIDAVEGLPVNDGDTVIVLPGLYTVDETIDINAAITVRGQPGAAPPVIEADTGVMQVLRSINASVVVEDLVLESDFANFTGVLSAFMGNVFQRLQIRAGGETAGGTAAVVSNGAILRDSIAVSTAPSGPSIMSGGSGGVFHNVTAVATGLNSTGAMATASFGRPQTMVLRNVIASGTLWDIQAIDDQPTSEPIEVDVAHSNFDTSNASGTDAEIDLGPGNQSDPPLFVNAAGGDYHQLPGSPTRNAGVPSGGFMGPLDVDRQPRINEGALDIGGDEFFESAAGPPGGGGGGSGGGGSLAIPSPSNLFALGKLQMNKKKGIAFLLVNVPGPGELGLSGKGVQPIGGAGIARKSLAVSGGEARLRIAPAKGKKGRKVRSKLESKGKARVLVQVTYTPTGGTANTQATKLKLVKK